MIRKGFILLVMLAVTVGVIWNFVKEALIYSPIAEIQSTEVPPDEKAVQKPDIKAAWGPEILDRNLFSSLRGEMPPPPEPLSEIPPVEEMKPEEPKGPELKLNGIILNQYGEYVAYLVKDNQSPIALRKGDTLDDLEVADISDRTLKLIWNEKEIVLTMTEVKSLHEKEMPRR